MVTTWYYSLHKVQGVQGNCASNTTVLSGDITYTLYRRHIRTLSQVHLRRLRQIIWIWIWKDHIPNVEVLSRANMSSIEATPMASQLGWTGHITRMNDTGLKTGLPKSVFYGELTKGWTNAAIQRCSQKTPEGYTHRCRHLGDFCTRSTTVESGHSQGKKPY